MPHNAGLGCHQTAERHYWDSPTEPDGAVRFNRWL